MATTHDPILLHLAQMAIDGISKSFPELDSDEMTCEILYEQLSPAPNLTMGHIALPCFPLAKLLRKSPPQIAQALAPKIETDKIISQVKQVGPYLNFILTPQSLGEMVVEPIICGDYFERQLVSETQTIMLEYSQPNTHKELHVGHMRNLSLGSALVSLNRQVGNKVVAVTYPGDVGTHVAKSLWYLKNCYQGDIPTSNQGTFLGKIYQEANQTLDSEQDLGRKENNKEQLTLILKELEQGEGEYFKLWQKTREWSLELFKKSYHWSRVEFDRWYWESEMDRPSIEMALNYYQQGVLIKDQGAIGMDLSKEEQDLGFCMLIKSDGTGLYATKDIALAMEKLQEYQLDSNLYLVDKRQAFHFQQVFKTLEKLGFKQANKCRHLAYDFVELPEGPMSSRAGNIVPLMELVESMEQKIKDDYLHSYQKDWSKEQINSTASAIADGAIKYGMIRIDNNRKIVFEMEEWLKLEGETGPYLQYVHARINSLTSKQAFNPETPVDWKQLEQQVEISLMLLLMRFNQVLVQAATQYKTMAMTSYLYDLGKLYNRFYAECPVGKADTEKRKEARLALSKACQRILAKGLESLNIIAPEQM
ncbi:MAG: arginine--tRNA ligase [Bdellovibrionales bacterium]|jgi:arginyl-tRNA synthetase|nr:arginine--tRNA ligase [Bdellovibrionales bacterium]MBT3524842.1 arginine--tRNA ligase [Bdellovibrionales bacterium]MBT7670467.1 arginine--tRNA ligase [Bdellovibrionales bacterium]MBT7767205.1 arginine--tRNA ligase [Bdellovibrionales bacterium]